METLTRGKLVYQKISALFKRTKVPKDAQSATIYCSYW